MPTGKLYGPIAAALLITAGCEQPPAEAPKEEPPAQKPTEEPNLIPEGVTHVENPEFVDTPTPTDMPDFDAKKTAAAYKQLAKKHEAAFAAACKRPDQVVRLVTEGTRIGYQSYKNAQVPVPGFFEEAAGFMTTSGKKSALLWINPLSINSGDPVRDRKLLKLFFELENPDHAAFVFTTTQVHGELPAKAGETSSMSMTGALKLHDEATEITLPFEVTATEDGYTAKLKNELELLQLQPFELIKPLEALIRSCNHSAMGKQVNLQLELTLKKGCG